MNTHTPAVSRSFFLAMSLILTVGALLFPTASRAQNINETARSGPYTFNLKVLPPESFHGAHAEMVRDGGARPELVDGPMHPNHHLVVFIARNGKPVDHARVTITYRRRDQGHGKKLPVVRMHVAGKGLATTHYGNNVNLAPGSYEARVTVGGKSSATFHFTLEK